MWKERMKRWRALPENRLKIRLDQEKRKPMHIARGRERYWANGGDHA